MSDSERAYLDRLVRRIVAECPRRPPASEGERRAQEILAGEFEVRGLAVERQGFRFNRSLYAALALHFGLALAGSAALVSRPAVALALHLVVAASLLGESTKRASILRRLFPYRPSGNLLAVRAARTGPGRRIVLVAHADAASTGFLFRPEVIRRSTRVPGPRFLAFLGRPNLVAILSLLALAALDAVALAIDPGPALLVAAAAFSVPSALGFLLNLEVAVRARVVPGASDNLSGCAALLVLADRLASRIPDDVEVVFVATGCEEAGAGGAWALARARRGDWERDRTAVLAVDTLSGGTLRILQDGDVVAWPIPPRIARAAARAGLEPFRIPAGMTDAAPFLAAGYEAAGFGCVDPEIGAPRNYHLPTDDPDHLDLDVLVDSIDRIEAVVLELLSGV